MAALRDIARDFAAEIRDGIGWTIVYRTGRSWNALTIWSDIWNGEWETDDLNDAIGILKADPDAVIVNGYYCGHFGEDMTIDEIAAGIRWHYEGGHNRLADYCEVTQGRDALEEGRKAAEAAGLPFCERLADGGDDELSPYVYDGSMALADHEKMQQAREALDRLADALREIAAGIRWHYEGGHNRLADYCEVTQGRDALEEGRKAAEAAGLPFCERLADGGDDELSPYVYDGSMALADHEKMQQAREALDRLADALREIAAKLAEAMKPVINAVLSAFKKLWKVSVRAIGVPPKWLHLAAHAKKARTRKKYRNRIRRYVFEALAAEGGGGP